jgi:hypothetical protein
MVRARDEAGGGLAVGQNDDVDRLFAYIKQVELVVRVPGLWPGNVELALIDAVFSIRARYGVTQSKGVRGALHRYRDASGRESWDDLSVLASMEPSRFREVIGNKQKTGGVLKADAVLAAAGNLVKAGVRHAADVDRNSKQQRAAYCNTKGLGPVTWSYFTMLVGHDGVKADTQVTRFVERALERTVGTDECERLVTEAAKKLDMPATVLDHSIWRYMSKARLN